MAKRSTGLTWTGVTICRLTGQGDDDCQFFGEQEARTVDDALAMAVPSFIGQAYCEALTPAYTVKFNHPSALTAPITVRVGCGPMEVGDQDLLLPDEQARLVQQVHADAAVGASVHAFIRRCFAPIGELPSSSPGFVGKREADAAKGGPTGARVVGRDGVCLPRSSDYVPDREDLLVVRGRVVFAASGR